MLRPQPYVVDLSSEEIEDHELRGWECIEQPNSRFVVVKRMPYASGDRLWVREAYFQVGHWEPAGTDRTAFGRQRWRFVADDPAIAFEPPPGYRKSRSPVAPGTPIWHKRLGRFMPRSASRLTLLVDAVKIERLNDISEADAIAEGIGDFTAAGSPTHKRLAETQTRLCWPQRLYALLWDEINGTGAWAANPWIVAVTFRTVQANVDNTAEAA